MGRVTSRDIQEIFGGSEAVTGLFDEIRIVQSGGTHRICAFENGALVPTGQLCHEYWHRCSGCANCVSRKAAEAGHKMVKLEYVNDNYYFVLAKPFLWRGGEYILELITNITTEMTTETGTAARNNFVKSVADELARVSGREGFTGLYNKDYFERDLAQRLQESRRAGKPLYLAMFDIDKFKTINDVYGHVQGDAVLLRFSEIVHKALHAPGSYAARFGGDEFALVLPQQSETECETLLQGIKRTFDETSFSVAEMSFSVTASYGLAEVSGADDAATAIQRANVALSKAKKAEKNEK